MKQALSLLVCLSCLPAVSYAQAALAGAVTDGSGAVIPGVSVVATSDALIENTRTAVTDNAGRYRIEDLRPGRYQVRFSLGGWQTYEQTAVDLTASLTTTVHVQLAIGSLTDTVSVTSALPPIDVQSARRAVTMSSPVIRSLPTSRNFNSLLVLIPGVVTTVNDTIMAPSTMSFPMHGGRQQEGRLLLDGLTVGSPAAGNSATMYDFDVGEAQEVTFATSGGLGEWETSGLVMNIIPKSGANATHGSLFASGTGEALQSSNLTPELIARRVTRASPYSKVYDLSGSLGGALAADRVWYFLGAHTGGSTRKSTIVRYNLNAADPAAWLYAPDADRPAYSDRTFERAKGRVTWQLTPRNKIGVFWDAQTVCRACTGATPGLSEPQQISPEAVGVLGRRLDVTQATWSSPRTNRLLLEAGYGGIYFGVGNFEREPNPTRDLVRVVEQCASGCAANGGIPGLTYRSQDFSVASNGSYLWKGSVSFVTGTHMLKAGFQRTHMTDDRRWMTNDQSLTYRVDNGVPNQLTQSISPWVNDARAAWQAWFLQEQWTVRRLTLQGAVRFDRAWSWFPEQQEGPSRFLPVPLIVPETRGVDSYTDITPRLGIVYDLTGHGTTAVKMSLGRYLEGVGVNGLYANANPTLRMPQTTMAFATAGVTRAWNDANGNFVPDCNLGDPGAQDFRANGGDLCGVVSNVNFGRSVLTNAFDPGVLSGWGVRPSDWNLVVSIQQRIGKQSAVDVAYTRRSFHGFTVADNLAVGAADLTPFSILAPNDPRLPGGGGYRVDGLYDVVPDKAGQVNNLLTGAAMHGRWGQHFNGVDVTVQARAGRSVTFAGGTSTGQTVADNCDVRARLPELSTAVTGTSAFGAGLAASAVTPLSPYCHVAYGVLTQLRGLSSYVVPKLDLQIAATFQSKPGALLAANYAAPNSVVAPSLGRNLSGNAPNATVNLIEPGSMYGDRINQIDLRFAKVFGVRGSRATVGVDVYNALNSSAVLTYNNSFVPGGTWLQPLMVLTPRLFKVTAALDW